MQNKAMYCCAFLVSVVYGNIDHDVQLLASALEIIGTVLPASHPEAPSSASPVQTGIPMLSGVAIPIVLFAQAVSNAVAEPAEDTARKHIALGWLQSALEYIVAREDDKRLSQEDKNLFCTAQKALLPLVSTKYVFYSGYRNTYKAYQNIIDVTCKKSAAVSLPAPTERNVVSRRELPIIMKQHKAAQKTDENATLTLDSFLEKPTQAVGAPQAGSEQSEHTVGVAKAEPALEDKAAKNRKQLVEDLNNFISLADEASLLHPHDPQDAKKRIELVSKLTECMTFLNKWSHMPPELTTGLEVKFLEAREKARKAAELLPFEEPRTKFFEADNEMMLRYWLRTFEAVRSAGNAPAVPVITEASIFKQNNTAPYSLETFQEALKDLHRQIDVANEDRLFYGESTTVAVDVVTALEFFANILKQAPDSERANLIKQLPKALRKAKEFDEYIREIRTQIYGSDSNPESEKQKKELVRKKYNDVMKAIESLEISAQKEE